MLRKAGRAVWVVLVSDGTGSHPGSTRFDADRRRALRDAEMCAALACLEVSATRLVRLGLPDGNVPDSGAASFDAASARLANVLDEVAPQVLVLPWRRDPHPDHRASHALAHAAARRSRASAARVLEYLVWAEERAEPADLPRQAEVVCRHLDIGSVVAAKRHAIAAHRSQLGLVIDDDPNGFTIAPQMRRRAERPVEYFFESRGDAVPAHDDRS